MTSVVTTAGTFAFFKLSPHHIHVYVDGIRQAVINSAECIKCYCVETQTCDDEDVPSAWMLWLGSDTGSLFSVQSVDILKLTDKSDDNQDIFNTLLASQAPTQHRVRLKQKASQRVLKIAPTDAGMKLSDSVLSISSHRGLLCVCTLTNSLAGKVYTLSVYRSNDISSNTTDNNLDPMWTKQISADGLGYYGSEKGEANPVVVLLSPNSTCPSDDKYAALYMELFSAMFGSESTLIDTSVVLFCSPSGIVFFFKLKNLQQSAGHFQDILCTIGQPVHSVHTFTVLGKEKSKSLLGSSQSETTCVIVCLAVIGQNGKCLLIFESNDELQYQTLTLPGPMVSSFSLANVLYMSTPIDLHRCKLYIVEKQEGKKSFEVSVSNLGNSGIVAILGVQGSSLDTVILYCFSKHGRLYTVCDEGNESDHKTVPGTQMKDLLLSIGRTNDDMDIAKHTISQQNDALGQLSIASKLAALRSGKPSDKATKARKLNKIVQVKVDVKQECFGSRREFSLVIKLTNKSMASLSSDWLMIVQIGHCLNNQGEITQSSVSKSIPLINGLRPETFEIIQIPLEGMQLKIPSLTVTTFLVYNLPGTGLENISSMQTLSPSNSPSALCITVSEKKLNILDFLYIPNPCQNVTSSATGNQQNLLTNSDMCTVEEIATEFARQRPTYDLYLPSQKKNKKQAPIHSLTINLTTSKMPDLQKCKGCSDVLKFLLSQTSVGSLATVEGSLTHVCTPGDHHVTLNVNLNQSEYTKCSTSNQSKSSEDTSYQNGYLLTLQGEDLRILVLMRVNLMERLFDQVVSQSGNTATDGGDVGEQDIRNLLHTFAGIHKKMSRINAPMTLLETSDSGDVDGTYTSLYEELRNVSLPHFI